MDERLEALEQEWKLELSLRCDKAGSQSDAAWYARGVLNGIRDARAVVSEMEEAVGVDA